MLDLTIAAAVNDRTVLDRCLKCSPDISDVGYPLVIAEGYSTAGQALNYAIDNSSSRYIAFVHQDVYLPSGWVDHVAESIATLEQRGTPWALLGVSGRDRDGKLLGQMWSTDTMSEYGTVRHEPLLSAAIDECVLILDRQSGLRFDPALPHFHMYGADMILQGREVGLDSFTIFAPIVHHCVPVKTLEGGYERAYRYMQEKWRHALPWPTMIVPLRRDSWALWRGEARRKRVRFKRWIERMLGRREITRDDIDPRLLARRAGYERDQFAAAVNPQSA